MTRPSMKGEQSSDALVTRPSGQQFPYCDPRTKPCVRCALSWVSGVANGRHLRNVWCVNPSSIVTTSNDDAELVRYWCAGSLQRTREPEQGVWRSGSQGLHQKEREEKKPHMSSRRPSRAK